MKKYLEIENATLEIFNLTTSQFLSFFKKNIEFIVAQNFKRIILHIKTSQFEVLKEKIGFIFSNTSISVIFYLNIDNLNIIDKKNQKNVILVNTNQNKIFNNKNIFNYQKLNLKNLDSIANLINNNVNFILKIDAKPTKIQLFNRIVTSLMENVKYKEINLSGLIIPTSLIKEHPCNFYLCNGWKCKKPISCLPRHFIIKGNSNVYPHDLFSDIFFVGNVKNKHLELVLEEYLLSKNYYNFIYYCQKSFMKYVPNYPYVYMPLIEYVKLEAENDR